MLKQLFASIGEIEDSARILRRGCLAGLCAFGLSLGVATAQDAQTAPVAEAAPAVAESTLNADMKAAVSLTAGQRLEEDFAAFAKEQGIIYGMPDAKGRVYTTAKCAVAEHATSPNFIRARTMAYEKAYHDAMVKAIMDMVGREVVEQSRKYFSDDSTNRMEPSQNVAGTMDRIAEKAAALEERKLDMALEDVGVDPQNVQGVSVREKRNLFLDQLVKREVKRAVGESAGFVPVATFEGIDGNGGYAIGVVLRYDVESKEIARCIARKTRPMPRPAGISLQEALPSQEELLQLFGVRVVIDNEGMPMLLSFGQWACDENAMTAQDPRRRDRAVEHATAQAESLADQQLTFFINSSLQAENINEIGAAESEDVFFGGNGEAVEKKVIDYVDRVTKTSTVRGSDTLAGRSTLLTRTLVHPRGQTVVVVVRAWSFRTLDQVRALQSKEAPKRPAVNSAPVPSSKTQGEEPAGVRRSRVYDF